jgi:hypothetical protein
MKGGTVCPSCRYLNFVAGISDIISSFIFECKLLQI